MNRDKKKEQEPLPFDDALRNILKAPHIKQERGKKRKQEENKPQSEKPPK